MTAPRSGSTASSHKRRWFGRLFFWYSRWRLKQSFSAVSMSGWMRLREYAQQGPFILASNHVAWWDPLVLAQLEGMLSVDAYCLMDAANLQQLPFFRWLGAVPVDRASAKKSYRDVINAATLLDGPGRVLIIFPQGRQRPAHLPLDFKMGVEELARRTGCPVVPMAIRYDFREEPRPELNVAVGEALRFSPGPAGLFLKELEDAVAYQLASIDSHLLKERHDFEPLIRRSSERLPLGTRALNLLTRRRST